MLVYTLGLIFGSLCLIVCVCFLFINYCQEKKRDKQLVEPVSADPKKFGRDFKRDWAKNKIVLGGAEPDDFTNLEEASKI